MARSACCTAGDGNLKCLGFLLRRVKNPMTVVRVIYENGWFKNVIHDAGLAVFPCCPYGSGVLPVKMRQVPHCQGEPLYG